MSTADGNAPGVHDSVSDCGFLPRLYHQQQLLLVLMLLRILNALCAGVFL